MNVLLFVLVGIALFPQADSFAQDSPRGESHFIGVKQTDMVAKSSASPDGEPDAVFSLSLKARASAPEIAAIEIRTTAGPRGAWSSRKIAGADFLGAAKAKEPSFLLNPKAEALNLKADEELSLLLFVTDDGKFSDKNRKFQAKIVNADGTSFVLPVLAEEPGKEESPPGATGVFPVRMSAVLKGISNYDAVSPGKTIKGDDKPDGLFVLSVEARDKEITGIEIRTTEGEPAAWDTIPSSKNWGIGVAAVSDPIKLLNKRDGTVAIPLHGRVDLNLYVADNGSIAKGTVNYRIAVTFRDGEIAWCPVKKASEETAEAPQEQPLRPSKVNFLGTWLGYVSTDSVGLYPGLKPDGKADAVFGLDIEVSPKNYISGIEINSMAGGTTRWGTTGTTPKVWGIGVAYQTAPTALLNRVDGSVRIPIEGRGQFYLYVADPGDLRRIHQGLRIIVHLADGSSYQQLLRQPSGTTPSVIPGVDESPKSKGAMTCEFRGFLYDFVNTSTRPGKDGYLDGTFILKLEVEDKKMVKVEVSGGDGIVRWSSEPKPPMMFLGVALYPQITKLINEQPGKMNVPLSGKRTVFLYAADNGMLSDPKAVLRVNVTFSDKSQLSTVVVK
ncbi:MAG: hypothetical protein HY914_04405 [Desulfomonile tiedjei]|nr:hypothetical protein [Desulfomonile tiedjei]